MLVSRHSDTESSHWPFGKLENTAHNPPATPPRMSSHYDSQLSTQADWQGHYPCLPQEHHVFTPSYEHGNRASDSSRPRSIGGEHGQSELDTNAGQSPQGPQGGNTLNLDQKSPTLPSPGHSDQAPDAGSATTTASMKDGSSPTTARAGLASATEQQDSGAAVTERTHLAAGSDGLPDNFATIKEEDEEILDDDDVDIDGEVTGRPMTAAERTAQRRKMKRFRLTHQQTRFLMSEFAKQPHPDAAHRERLSREIPGLSPRQVQVWFQNRRAKIKRLTADDRDRMIKMRAVPDDFDNVQALHSPYGAVHGLGTPIPSPVDFGSSPYGDHLMRPLVIDVRRADGESHMSPTGLSPAFGNIGFSTSASMSNPDLLSPLSPSPGDHRYGYGSHTSGSLTPGARPTHTFGRQTTLDNSMLQSRQTARPLQPLHLRESMTRSRSDNLHSPLRTGMSWKGDSIDYTTYAADGTSPPITGRQQSMYQGGDNGMTGPSSSSGIDYDSGHSLQPPSNINYTSYQPSGLQQTSQSRLRNRASSATLPLGLDLRNQYRSVSSTLHSSASHTPASSREVSSSASHFTGSSATSYSTSFPSAPLTAPMDFSMPRTPGSATHAGRPGGVQDYSIPQMSAPIAPPNDFTQAFDARTPLREAFGAGEQHSLENRNGHTFGGDFGSGAALKRKRSFTMPSSSQSNGPGAPLYGNHN